jgi:hypothetical protein
VALADLLPLTCDVTRPTAVVIGAASLPFNTNVTRIDDPAVLLKFEGLTLAGDTTVTVTGELDGVAQSEDVVVPTASPSIAISTKKWTKVTNLTATGTGTIFCDAVGSGGDPALVFTSIGTVKGRLRRQNIRTYVKEQGAIQAEEYTFYTLSGLTAKDRLTIAGITYEVENVIPIHDATKLHHYEDVLKRVS